MHLYLKICALVALCISAGAQAATNWQDLKVGGGGFVRGLNIASDGTMVGRTDTAGAYLWNGTAWVQLVTNTSIPAAQLAASPVSLGQGVYELMMAPGNSSIMYMMFNGYVFKSTNKGTTWTQTAFTRDSSVNPNDGNAQVGQKMAVDPNNANIVYVGTEAHGMYVTTNGGTTWSAVSGVPAGTGAGIAGILFYPGGGQVGGVTQVIYASSNSHGVYKTTNGGTTWTLTTGGPTSVQYAAISTGGIYYAVTGGAGIWSYNGTTWTQLNTATGYQIAINPFNQNELVVTDDAGKVNISYDAGSTWSGPNTNSSLSTPQIPWLLDANSFNGVPSPYFYLTTGGLAFSPVTNGQLILSAGTGTWNMTVPAGVTSSTALTWTDFSVGIENLVANAILVPPGGVPILASWDRPFFKITNPNAFPLTYGSVNSDTIEMGWSLDYASSNPAFIVGLSDWNGHEQTGYSTDGGATWTYFASVPAGASQGGTIAASTPQNIIWAPANKSQPSYTLNQGQSWTGISLPGVSSWSNFHWAYYLKQRSVTADRVLPNTFYLYYAGYGVFKTTNGGASWTNVHSGYIESNASLSGFNSTIMSVPGYAGHLFYTGGSQSGSTATTPVSEPFYRSTDGGATWTAVANVLAVSTFGFGAAATGQSYPAIYIVGYVNNVFGIWQSNDNAQTWTNIGTYPLGNLVRIGCISGDPNLYGEVYVGFDGGGYAYLPASGTQQIPIPMAPTNLTVH